ncbi:MAG: helix-turn-helix transcriptional regulator [Balneolaceae bacterium]|nr:helix-turn-helix transcriptional regulator [Balneolaceae bacterium]MBO6545155.1 helix-turn-helix transcriptional regulator [Balneolaceae bacterium]MBO6646551.1 helix-turn-helix transcriptional regulator [Balneolaceae bacterium]
MISQNIWTILITWGTVQCTILAPILFFNKKGNYRQRIIIGIILILVAIQSGNFLFEYFEWFKEYPHLIWVSYPFWFLIGPGLYFFQKFSINKNASVKWWDTIHLLPMILATWLAFPFYWMEGSSKVQFLIDYYTNYWNQADVFFFIYVGVQFLYGLYALVRFKLYFDKVGEQYSNTHLYQHRWVVSLIGGFLIFWALTVVFHLFLLDDYETFIRFDYATYLFLTLFVQILGFAAILNPETFFVTPIEQEGMEAIFDKEGGIEPEGTIVLEYMKKHEPYLNPGLKIGELADEIGIPSHRLSFIINNMAGKNFFEFVNEYRVKEVKKRLPDPQFKNLTIEAIARDCGFNSSASFYRVFKQQTGLTPKQYLVQKNS